MYVIIAMVAHRLHRNRSISLAICQLTERTADVDGGSGINSNITSTSFHTIYMLINIIYKMYKRVLEP